ncbi:MAG TPA: hypothetical protein VFG28_02050 [Syntrophales bacterium]|nr:hypothetical protein [Syntrophales bacterium]
MENPNVFAALGYYIVSSFLDPVQWLICGICGWKMERIEQAMIAGAAMVGVLYIILVSVYSAEKLFSFPSPHVGFTILGKAIGAALMSALIFWLKQKQMNRKRS